MLIQFFDQVFIIRITLSANMESCFRVSAANCFCGLQKLIDALLLGDTADIGKINGIIPGICQRLILLQECLAFLGHTLASSSVHERVIADLRAVGDDGGAKMEALRRQAVAGRDALYAGDLAAFGRAMVANTEAQEALNAALVSDTAHRIFDIARRHGAIGWKVNGAGGEGGSVTLLGSTSRVEQRQMLREIEALGGGVRVIDTYLSRYGLRVWEGR